MAIHYPGERGGLVVDFHALIEYLQHIIVCTDAIVKLNSLFKLTIETMTQGLVVKYFERTVPCLFTGATIHEVIKIKVVL